MTERWENFTPQQRADVERMTNWQRNQWARAGYPSDTGRFVEMVKATDLAKQARRG